MEAGEVTTPVSNILINLVQGAYDPIRHDRLS